MRIRGDGVVAVLREKLLWLQQYNDGVSVMWNRGDEAVVVWRSKGWRHSRSMKENEMVVCAELV